MSKFDSIRWRLIIGSLVATGLPLLAFMYLFAALLWSFFTNHLEQELRVRAGVLAETAAGHLVGEPDQAALEALVARWQRYSNVRITLLDREGTVLVATTRGFVGQPAVEALQPGLMAALTQGEPNGTVWKSPNFDYEDTMYINLPILHDGEVVGAVRMAHSLNQIRHEIREIQRALVGTSIAYGLVLVILMLWLARTISEPVEILERNARMLAAGNLEHRVPTVAGASEIRQLAATLNQMTERLGVLENARRQHVSDVSHELRTPLTSIRSIAETLITHRHDDPALAERYLPHILSQCDRLARLTTQLLDLHHIESRNLLSRVSVVSVAPVVHEVVQTLSAEATRRGVRVVQRVADDVPSVRADRDRLVQVFLNLIDNAVRYTEPGGRVTVALHAEGDRVIGEVADTGCGIPPEHLPRLFDRFYRVEQARTARKGGSGLGLAIAHQIVLAHGGEITVDSTPGVGTTFRVVLPAAPHAPS